MRRGVVIALVAASLVAAPAAAEVLCRTQARRVFARTSCKKGEVRFELPKGPTGDPGAAAPAPVRIVDGAGLQVGLFAELYTAGTNHAVFEVNGRLVALEVGRTGFLGDSGKSRLYHLAADCSDQRLVLERRAPFVRQGVVIGTTAYYAEDPVETKTPMAYEFFPEAGGCGALSTLPNGNCCQVGPYAEAYYGPATIAFDLPSLGFTPPFRLEP